VLLHRMHRRKQFGTVGSTSQEDVLSATAYLTPEDLPSLRTDTAAAAQAALANRAYARLLTSGTAVTTGQYVAALAERGVSAEGARARIKRDRDKQRLVTVTHEGESVVPTFQLEDDFGHSRLAGDAVQALLATGYGPWDIWDWAESPNPWIGRRTPSAAIRAGDTDAVAQAVAAATGDGPDA
jgi:hypothetical protein